MSTQNIKWLVEELESVNENFQTAESLLAAELEVHEENLTNTTADFLDAIAEVLFDDQTHDFTINVNYLYQDNILDYNELNMVAEAVKEFLIARGYTVTIDIPYNDKVTFKAKISYK